MEISPRTDDDWDALVAVARQVRDQDRYPIYEPSQGLRWFLSTPEPIAAWVARLDGVLVGHVALQPEATEGAMAVVDAHAPGVRAAYVSRLLVDPNHRGRRIGARLLDHARRAATAAGFVVFLEALDVPEGAAAMDLYRRAGWVELGRTVFALLDDGTEEVVFAAPGWSPPSTGEVPGRIDLGGIDLGGIDLSDPDTFAAGPPHAAYRALRDQAPLFWHEPTAATPDGEGFWCLTRHEDVSWAAKDSERFSSAGGGGRAGGGTLIEDLPAGFAAGVLLNMQDDPRHHHIRRIVTPSLSPKRLRALRGALAERCDEILDAALESGEVDFLVDVAAELPLQAIASLLGIPQADRHFLLDWADATLDYDDRDPGADSARSQSAAVAMADYVRRLLEEKQRRPAEDILSAVIHADLPAEADPGGPLSDLEVEMFVHLLVAAGSETTRNTIAAGVLALIDRPDDWAALRADRSLLPGAIEEMLRWASSTVYNRRTATVDVERHGRTIRSGDKVVLWWQAANFDERVFADPYTFDVRRDPNPHLAFGIGSHFCLGSNLARLEIALVFDGLLDRVARPELIGPIERTRSNKHAGFRHLPLRLDGG